MHLNYNTMWFQAFAAVQVKSALFLALYTAHNDSFLLFCAAQGPKTAQILHYHFTKDACFFSPITKTGQLILFREGMAVYS